MRFTIDGTFMIVCQCRRVSDRKVANTVKKGCGSLRELCAQTGAGQECGCCVSRLKEILESHLAAPASMEAARATA
jgi:bacterioferritin-associated ferredoxin